MDEKIYNILLKKCYRLIARRPRTKKEMLDYLHSNKELNRLQNEQKKTTLINCVLSKLKEEKLIDDYRFISWWVDQRKFFRPRSKKALIYELKLKGISQNDIVSYFSHNEIDELQEAINLIVKKKYLYKDIKQKTGGERAISYLLRQGFSYELAKKAIEHFCENRYNS